MAGTEFGEAILFDVLAMLDLTKLKDDELSDNWQIIVPAVDAADNDMGYLVDWTAEQWRCQNG